MITSTLASSRTKLPPRAPAHVVSQVLKYLDQLVIPHLLCARTDNLSDRVVAPACAPRAVCRSRRSVCGGLLCQRRVNALRLLASTLVVLLAALVAPAQAQQFNGTLRGVVQDSTGGVLPGAEVSVVEVSTNDTRSLTTDARGSWVLPNLKPGTYRIVVSLDGFKTAALDKVKLDVQGDPRRRGLARGRRRGRNRHRQRPGRRRRSHELDAQPDHREQAHGRSAAERPQPVLAGHARPGRRRRRRTTAARRRRSAAAATRPARSPSTASRTSTPRTTSRSST